MVTIKKEVAVESATPADTQQWIFDHFGGPPTWPVTIAREQPPWSHPGPAGPQERYESEFHVPPPTWLPATNPQPKPDNRTIPTTLDQYQMQLKLLEQEDTKRRAEMAGQQQEVEDWTPPPGWKEFVAADYQTQLKLLEEQNKTHIPMARPEQGSAGPVSGKDWIPPPGWRESLLPDYQEALKYLEQQDKTRLAMPSQENGTSMAPPSTTSRGTTLGPMSEAINRSEMTSLPTQPGLPYAAAGDYQVQLLLLEQQNKKRLMMARQEQDARVPHALSDHQKQLILLEQQNKKRLMMAMRELDSMTAQGRQFTPEATPAGREQSVESTSTWTTQFTPESTPGFQEREPSMDAPSQIQMNFMESHPNGSDLGQNSPHSSYNRASSGQILGDHDIQFRMLEQQNQASPTTAKQEDEDTAASGRGPNWSLQHYQGQLMLKEQQNRIALETQEEGLSSPTLYPGNHALQDYQMQLMLLEQQNKKRKVMEKQEEERKKEAKETRKVQRQLRLLEQQNAKRLMEKSQPQASTSAGQPIKEWVMGEEQVMIDESAWITTGSRDLHNKPLVIRERPTCDD